MKQNMKSKTETLSLTSMSASCSNMRVSANLSLIFISQIYRGQQRAWVQATNDGCMFKARHNHRDDVTTDDGFHTSEKDLDRAKKSLLMSQFVLSGPTTE